MMTAILCACPRCGEIRLDQSSVWLHDDGRRYAFTCPACDDGIVKKADGKIFRLLRGAGVPFITEIVEAEFGSTEEAPWLSE